MAKSNKATDSGSSSSEEENTTETSETNHSAIHPPVLPPNFQPIGGEKSTSRGVIDCSTSQSTSVNRLLASARPNGMTLPLTGGALLGHLNASILPPINAPLLPSTSTLASEMLRHMASRQIQNSFIGPNSLQLTAPQMSGINQASLLGAAQFPLNPTWAAQLPFLHGGANFPLAIGAPGMFQGIGSSGRQSMLVYMEQDEHALSSYQCLVRKQIEIFEATASDIGSTAQGRNRPICLKQVGIRCRHCGQLPIERRARGAVYYPSQLAGLYQTAQNMANAHLIKDCVEIPKHIREDLIRIRLREKGASTRKSAYGGGRHYWADCLRRLGVIETADRRLCFAGTPLYNPHAGLPGI